MWCTGKKKLGVTYMRDPLERAVKSHLLLGVDNTLLPSSLRQHLGTNDAYNNWKWMFPHEDWSRAHIFLCKKENQFWQFSVPLLKCFPDPLQPPIHERIRNKLSKVLSYSSHDNKYSIEIDTHRQVSVRTREHKYAGVGLRRRISSLLLNTLTVCRDNLC